MSVSSGIRSTVWISDSATDRLIVCALEETERKGKHPGRMTEAGDGMIGSVAERAMSSYLMMLRPRPEKVQSDRQGVVILFRSRRKRRQNSIVLRVPRLDVPRGF
jgi:hypothetical protein